MPSEPHYTESPLDFIPRDCGVDEECADGFWHVTVAKDAVLAEGLKSRQELGYKVVGLGGGYRNQAPGLVSLTWSSGKASEIEEALLLAVKAARGEIGPLDVFNAVAGRYGVDLPGPAVCAVLRRVGIHPDILEDEDLIGFDAALEAISLSPEETYAFLQELDDAFEKEFDRTETFPDRVGLTAEWEMMASLDPYQIATLRVAVRPGAAVEFVPEEQELRFSSRDLVVLGPAFEVENHPVMRL